MSLTPLQEILQSFQDAAVTEREKGNYFEELTRTYLRNEPKYQDLYSDVWLLADVPDEYGISKKDVGIDLVAKTRDTGELHAIQSKFYAPDYHIQKKDIDSFFTASGQKPFTHRVIITTTTSWSDNAEGALHNQHIDVTKIDLHELEESLIDWSKYKPKSAAKLKKKFAPKPHQKSAIFRTVAGLKDQDRGKLIMACGTGKTFTSLKIAEQMAGAGKRVLFLVPSLALLSQTLTEWTQQSEVPLHSFAVCSDSEVGKTKSKTKADEDVVQTYAHELSYPATTDAKRLAQHASTRHDDQHMTVVFSTYHSIEVVSQAQKKHKLADFDLIICDEAHRTTGATFESESESAFVRVHDQKFIHGTKRLYMTATPRIYADNAKATAAVENVALCSMDDEALYGKTLHLITFSEAVELELLTDYKVIVLAIDQDHVSERIQGLLKDDNNQLKVDDAARIIGCWKALSKVGLGDDLGTDTQAMQKAVAFCQVIEPTSGKRKHKVSSKQISEMFQDVIDAYQETADDETSNLVCQTQHVDGSMNATEKGEKIKWLKEQTDAEICRILCNVRCLSEGVDVPALDAVLFLSPRSSQVEVVQSVGRVMRKAPGKERGYVILPVVIPHGMEAHDALNDNQVYKVVWEVLQALRSHDDRFDAFINKSDLLGPSRDKLEVVAITSKKMEVEAKVDKLTPKARKANKKDKGKGEFNLGNEKEKGDKSVDVQRTLQFQTGELEKALYAKLVTKCGNRMYWEEWANDIAKIAQTHIGRITKIVNNPANKKEAKAFADFADELRDDLNDSITNEEVIEMLAQHLITKPVFDALFTDYSFASNNPVSQGMQNILDLLQEHRLDKEADTLENFYASVRRRATGIDKAEGKQKIVVELYDKFFRNAFPKMTDRLGIVYTPVEVVDFIIHSVNDILQEEFGQTLGSKGVHILDPFVGTGTFITRLMQSGLITPEQLPHKYKNEIHCNEIVLLAYYIAAINIEAVYHSIMTDHAKVKEKKAPAYEPFEGILLTDTFAMYESDDMIEQFFPDNSERRKRQKKLDIRVIVGNPPYSAGQTSENDNNKNVTYAKLDEDIRTSYAARSSAVLKSALYDSYIRAIRWASDRVGESGVVAIVTNGGFLTANYADGLRACLSEEFSRIYVYNLRGNARTSGEQRRKEKDNVFGQGTRTPVAITILVKNSSKTANAEIKWHDIGDYLSRVDKLRLISEARSVRGISNNEQWKLITPNEHHDWVNQRDNSFLKHIPVAAKNKQTKTIFHDCSGGVKTNRDAWCCNFSKAQLTSTMERMVAFYNAEVERYKQACKGKSKVDFPIVNDFVDTDPTKISWTREVKQDLARFKSHQFDESSIVQGTYRPFTRTWVYFSRQFNNCVYQMPRVHPHGNYENLSICISGIGNSGKEPSVLIVDTLPDLNIQHSGGQCLPLFLFEEDIEETTLFSSEKQTSNLRSQRQAITDNGLDHFQSAYPGGDSITKEDLFYYIYGLLHSPEYRERYKDNLSKELPRIPAVKKFEDFQAFSQAGRDLAHWHLNYETVDCHEVVAEINAPSLNLKKYKIKVFKDGTRSMQNKLGLTDKHFYVKKMKFAKCKDPETGKSVNDKTTVIYNEHITVHEIPLEAYDYVVNGKPAIEWVMERQAVTTDKKSGIVNDANLWATETMNSAAYPLELLLRVINVSLQTNQIVASLPKLDID